MRSLLTGRTRRYVDDAARAFERAPAEVAIAVALAVAFSWAVEVENEAFRVWWEFAVGSVVALLVAWSATLLHGLGAITLRQRWIATVGATAAAAAYILFVADFQLEAEGWRAAMLVGGAVLLAVAAPAAARPGGWASDLTASDRMRLVTGRVLLRIIGALLYCGALYAGLALAIGAVNTLFELNLAGSIFAHVFGWIFLVLAPWIVVGGLSDYVQPPAPQGAVAAVVNRMAAFLVPPLLALYYLILYAYTVRIGITGEVPKNLVSPLVFAAGALAALGLLLFDPRTREATAFRTLRAAPPLFLPLSVLGAWAITLRVSQYGWTEFRLLRLLLLAGMALLAIGATVQLVRRQRLALHVIPLALGALLLLGAAGPWSVLDTARRSQQARLERALASAGVDPRQPVEPGTSRQVSREQYQAVSGATQYLVQHFGVEALPASLRTLVTAREDAWDIGRRLGLEPVGADTVGETFAAHLPHGTAVRLNDLTIRRLTGSSRQEAAAEAHGITQDSARLLIRADGEQFVADFGVMAEALAASHRGVRPGHRLGALGAESARLDVRDAMGSVRGSLIVLDAFVTIEAGGPVLQRMDALLVLQPRQ